MRTLCFNHGFSKLFNKCTWLYFRKLHWKSNSTIATLKSCSLSRFVLYQIMSILIKRQRSIKSFRRKYSPLLKYFQVVLWISGMNAMTPFAVRRKTELGVCKKIENFVISNSSFFLPCLHLRHGFIVFFVFFFFVHTRNWKVGKHDSTSRSKQLKQTPHNLLSPLNLMLLL